jgi:hypothetical protein
VSEFINIETTQAIPDICHDFLATVKGEVCELLIPQSRREYHLLEAVREARREDESEFRVLMLGYTAGDARYAVFRGENPIAVDVFPCLLISGGGNMTDAAMLDVRGGTVFIAPSWEPQSVEWNDGEHDPDKLAELLKKLSSSPLSCQREGDK